MQRVATGERRVQVLFMDYLTCPGYNPPKASIRIIASSSSRLCGCYRPPLRHSLSQPRSASILHPSRHPTPPSLSRDANLHRCVAGTILLSALSPSSQLPFHAAERVFASSCNFEIVLSCLSSMKDQFSASYRINRETI